MITDVLLQETAVNHRAPFLALPMLSLASQVEGAITVRSGIQWKETVSEIFADAELAPYTGSLPAAANMDDQFQTSSREIEVFLGSCVLREDPRQLMTLATSLLKKYSNKSDNSHPLEVIMLSIMQGRLGERLARSLFNAVRNPGGLTTKDLYNGFDTIAAAEVAAGTLSVANGNYEDLGALTQANIIDKLDAAYASTADELKEKQLILMMNYATLQMYNRAVKEDLGSAVYNEVYNQKRLHFAENVSLRWFSGKKNTPFMQLTTSDIMECGNNGTDEKEYIEVRRGDNPFKWQFINCSTFGAQYRSLDQTNIKVLKFS